MDEPGRLSVAHRSGGHSTHSDGQPEEEQTSYVAVYVVVSLVLLALLGLMLYVCCSKRYRLNWFEQSLLETQRGVTEEKTYLNSRGSSLLSHKDSRTITLSHGSNVNIKYVSLRTKSVDSMGSNPSSPDREENSSPPPSLSHTPQRIGSFSGQGVMAHSSKGALPSMGCSQDRRDSKGEFWVPPTILQKKRAQSLIPQILQVGGTSADSSGSPIKTPTSSSSMQEMMFSFPAEKTENVTVVQIPAGGQRRRRASMQDALDHTKINASLYSMERPPVVRQDSIGSIQEENLGSVNFSLDYDHEQSLLTIRLIMARDLVSRDFSGTADPYCRMCLLPNNKVHLQSRVHKKTLNPEFEEEFIFEVAPSEISGRTLEILVFDYDQFSRDECIGQIHLGLCHVDLQEKVTLWKGISAYEKKKEETNDLGDLMFSLAYLSSAERLTVVVMKCRNLKCIEDNKNNANPFVKVSLIADAKRLKKKKTSTKRNTLNPIWNEALVYSLGKEYLHNISIEFVLFNDNLLGNNEVMGKVVIGPLTAGEELAHWNDVMNSKNAMARWHHLLPTTEHLLSS